MAPALPITIVSAASAASAGDHSGCASSRASWKRRRKIAEGGGLGGHGHERGDRRRSALVDVGSPLVEGRGGRLEREPGGGERDPGEEQRVGDADLVADRRGDRGKVGGPGGAVDERQPVEERGRPDGADHQVLEARLERLLLPHPAAAEHVERDRQQLEPDEQGDEVVGRGEHGHPANRREQQRVVLAAAGLADARRPQREQHREEAGGVEQDRQAERERVHHQRALDDRGRLARLPVHDGEDGRRDERGDRERGHESTLDRSSRQQPHHQHHDRPAERGDDRRQGEVVDLGRL